MSKAISPHVDYNYSICIDLIMSMTQYLFCSFKSYYSYCYFVLLLLSVCFRNPVDSLSSLHFIKEGVCNPFEKVGPYFSSFFRCAVF